jgi:hypothetical protein
MRRVMSSAPQVGFHQAVKERDAGAPIGPRDCLRISSGQGRFGLRSVRPSKVINLLRTASQLRRIHSDHRITVRRMSG